MRQFAFLVLFLAHVVGCQNDNVEKNSSQVSVEATIANEKATPAGRQDQEAEIRKLIQQLVFSDGDATNQPIVNPNMKIVDADGNVHPSNGDSDDAEKQRE